MTNSKGDDDVLSKCKRPLPLYEQIIVNLMNEIHMGAFSYDRPFVTESALTARYGVSRITVRRALSELERRGILYRKRGAGSFVSREMYNKSEFPDEILRAERDGSSHFAFIVPFNVSRTGMTEAYQAACEYFRERGCRASIYVAEEEGATRGHAILSRLTQSDVAGVAYYPYTDNINLALLNYLMFSGKSVVLMDLPSPCRHVASVTSDNLNGVRSLMDHLLSLGHRRIAFLSSIDPPVRATLCDRFSGYLLSLTQAGIAPDPALVHVDMTDENRVLPASDARSMAAVLRFFMARGVTAVVCEHDMMAHRVLETCRELGISVPGELSVAGFDDNEWATIMPGKRLTTVAQDQTAIGRAVARLLCEGMAEPLAERTPLVIPTSLVVGNTTGKPKQC